MAIFLKTLPVLILALGTPASAYGYIDPGTGTFLFQVAGGILLGGLFSLRKFFGRLFSKLK